MLPFSIDLENHFPVIGVNEQRYICAQHFVLMTVFEDLRNFPVGIKMPVTPYDDHTAREMLEGRPEALFALWLHVRRSRLIDGICKRAG